VIFFQQTTLGIPILIVLLRLMTALVSFTPLGKPAESIQSGNYGNPPNAWWWLKQSVVYFIGLFGMKLCVLIIFIMMPWISQVGDWALGWTEGNERVQIAFVMMIFPLIMNALQYYIIDSFIKKKETLNDHERLPSDDPDEHGGAYDDASRPSDLDEDEARSVGAEEERLRSKKNLASETSEYDPDVDGEARSVVGSSSSNQRPPATTNVSPSLYPKE
jgi:hypothetical protein